ncbi:serine/threonine-protein phosphatase 7 long form homolog [Impatiens glandulifera]|uniref:serine/threonine-protein phosphatase 7 long form homolog n=1 Tax=Impatiens glandulifera TaxID=253017 RepID=UPI001FB177A7|nr:serine/threonine-protein phosphatase 7 long form homolog [Impatiens glandulifera]
MAYRSKQIFTRNHQVELSKWNLDNRVLLRINETGFENIHHMHNMMRTDLNLFLALIHCYSLEEHCFIIGHRRIVPTLEDVLRIMGLPIDGKAVTGKDFERTETEELCYELLGDTRYISGRSGTEISLKGLRENLQYIPRDSEDIDIYVRAYVLHGIGCLICPSMNPSGVSSMFLGLLRNIDELKNFAWGAAFLAQSMNQVRHLKTNIDSATTTGACIPFFMVFLFEHVNGLTNASMRLNQIHFELPIEFPLLVSWSFLLVNKSKNNHGKLSVETFLHFLERSEILPRPYNRLDFAFLPPYLRSHLHVAYTHTVLICFEQLTHHKPHIFPEKMGLEQRDIGEIHSLPKPSSKQRKAAEKPDWALKFNKHVAFWNNRTNHFICSYDKLIELGVVGENEDEEAGNEDDDEEAENEDDDGDDEEGVDEDDQAGDEDDDGLRRRNLSMPWKKRIIEIDTNKTKAPNA